jgi:quercetin dioxygenase-like cupin family protein
LSDWRGTLSLFEHPHGVRSEASDAIVYDIAAGEARFGPAELTGHALVWQLEQGAPDTRAALLAHAVTLDASQPYIARCDRIDFPPGGIAYTHTHPGPGIRYQLEGSITIRSEGRETRYVAGEPWFEAGPEPVHATAATDRPSAFVRVLIVPAIWEGRRTISYVDPEDEQRPKLQRPTVFFDRAIELSLTRAHRRP